MDEDRILARERYQIEQIRELDDEELQVEEVEGLPDDSDDDDAMVGEFTFDTCLASLHTYLGEVEDTHHRAAFVDTGAVLVLPLFYLEGVVLFPEATLPLRIIQPNFIVAVERAMGQVDSPYTIGVVRVFRDPENGRLRFASIGTTAEPCGEIEVIEENLPSRTPRDAFGTLPLLNNLSSRSFSDSTKSHHQAKRHRDAIENIDSDAESEESFLTELSLSEMRLHQSAVESCCAYDAIDESTSSDDEKYVCESEFHSGRSQSSDGSSRSKYRRSVDTASGVERKAVISQSPQKGDAWGKRGISARLNHFRAVPRAFWPYWVYQMYDSFSLAQKAADMWKHVVGAPSMDGFVRKPDILSFYIASKIPISECTRQELLEINGVSYRLRREIELLEGFDRVRCKNCQTVIARRSDMLVMSNEGPLGAYVNPSGFVHEIMTLYKANGLALIGQPREEYSWFPGYAWTIANCATCERHMGWLFTARNKKLKPKSFWGVRSSQVADDMR
ncbi:Protein cereblon [Bienertia sinuspersici]